MNKPTVLAAGIAAGIGLGFGVSGEIPNGGGPETVPRLTAPRHLGQALNYACSTYEVNVYPGQTKKVLQDKTLAKGDGLFRHPDGAVEILDDKFDVEALDLQGGGAWVNPGNRHITVSETPHAIHFNLAKNVHAAVTARKHQAGAHLSALVCQNP